MSILSHNAIREFDPNRIFVTRKMIADARKRAKTVYDCNGLLSVDSDPKTAKSNASGQGYYTAILYLAPHRIGGFNVCPQAGQCTKICLHEAGNPVYQRAKNAARIARKTLFFKERFTFFVLLFAEIRSFVAKCKKLGLQPCIRLNGTSDIVWESVAPWIFTFFPDVVFYDYTKISKRVRAGYKLPPNYTLTFSRDSQDNEADCHEAIANGFNVAICFDVQRTKALPEKWFGIEVIDGDKTDLRFLDRRGVVVGLRAKGPAKLTPEDRKSDDYSQSKLFTVPPFSVA